MTPVEQLAGLHSVCFETPRPWSASEFENLLAEDGVFLVDADGGFLVARVVFDEAELLTLAVKPERRCEGIGTKLVKSFEHSAQDQGARCAFIEVSAVNDAAKDLYAKLGYTEIARRPDYYRRPDGSRIDAILMHRALA